MSIPIMVQAKLRARVLIPLVKALQAELARSGRALCHRLFGGSGGWRCPSLADSVRGPAARRAATGGWLKFRA